MTYMNTWEEFEQGAERLYLQDPLNVILLINKLSFCLIIYQINYVIYLFI